MQSLTGCTVELISEAEARPIIRAYEWLGTLGLPEVCAGLRDPTGELVGVALFGHTGSPEARNICGPEVDALCLTRGACTHWAHPHAASYLIPRACRLATEVTGTRVFYAYADPQAGEIGTVYQACNWLYIGQGIGRRSNSGTARYEKIADPSGRLYSARSLRHLGLTLREAKELGWRPVKVLPKHKYVHFVGNRSEVKTLRAALRFPVLPYPKR